MEFVRSIGRGGKVIFNLEQFLLNCDRAVGIVPNSLSGITAICRLEYPKIPV
jgi:hypothetical protein